MRDERAQSHVGQPARVAIEVREDSRIGHDPESFDGRGTRAAEVLDRSAHHHRPRTAAGKSCPALPGGPDRIPRERAAQGLGEERGISAGEVDQARALDEGHPARVHRILARANVDHHLLGVKALSGLSAEAMPVRETAVPLGCGRGRQLDVDPRVVGEEPVLDLAEDGEVFPAAHQGESTGHAGTLGEPAVRRSARPELRRGTRRRRRRRAEPRWSRGRRP